MKNIFRIFYRDFKRVSTNVVAVVIVIGLSIIPSLYAWFNILSNWDPYGPESTSNLKIAVYSADEGIDMGGLSLNIGDSVIDALKANQTMGTKDYIQGKNGSAGTGKCNLCQHTGRSHVKGK